MSVAVLDASVFVSSLLRSERRHPDAIALLGRFRTGRFLVPSIFEVEVIAALARRDVAGPVIDGVRAAIATAQFDRRPVDPLVPRATAIAATARLRAYDALYAALALQEGAPLLTFDDELRVRLGASFPELVVLR